MKGEIHNHIDFINTLRMVKVAVKSLEHIKNRR